MVEKVQALLEIKNFSDIVPKVVELLVSYDYAPIIEFSRLGGNIMATDPYRNNTILHKIIELGHESLLERYIEEASIVDQQPWIRDEDNPGTLLLKACERNVPSLHLIKCLVEKIGLNVNVPSNSRVFTYKMKNSTALHYVACGLHFWHVEAVAYFLAQGSNIEAENAHGQTPLLCAISTDWPSGFWKEQTINLLLSHGANPNACSNRGLSNSLTCLEAADNARILEALLRNGADIKAVPGIIQRAVDKMDPDMVQVLIKAGANLNYLSHLLPTTTTTTNNDGDEGCIDVNEGDSKSQGGSKSGDTESDCGYEESEEPRYPLHRAARPTTEENVARDWDARQRKVVETLLEYGADPYAPYPDGSYALQAIVEDHGLFAPFLELETLDIEKCGRLGRTLLLSACICNKRPHPTIWEPNGYEKFPATAKPEIILALLQRGAAVNVMDVQGKTPLHYLCTMNHPYDEHYQKAFAAIVSQGPSLIHMMDSTGFKPLHRAIQADQRWAIRYLIDHGADPSEADPEGNTALHHLAAKLVGEKAAAAGAKSEFEHFLKHHKLDLNARNKKGETPLFICVSTDWVGTQCPTDVEYDSNFGLKNDVSPSDLLEFFANARADIFAVDNNGSTLLHAAAGRRLRDSRSDHSQHAENTFKELMRMGLDPLKEDKEMRTAIDVAVARRRRGIIDLFAEKK